jgi:hypothetical protein
MYFRGVQNQQQIFKRWAKLINAKDDIQDDVLKMSTAIVLENAQQAVNHEASVRGNRSLLFESAGVTTGGSFGPGSVDTSYAVTARANGQEGDARVPSIVIPMIRRIYPQLIAHKLVGVQPMQGPIGMAFAFRAKYGRFGRGEQNVEGQEIGYLNVDAAFTGKQQFTNKFDNKPYSEISSGDVTNNPQGVTGYVLKGSQDQGALSGDANGVIAKMGAVAADLQNVKDGKINGEINPMKYFMGDRNYGVIGDGADTSDAENWAVGKDMPEAGFEILKATVTAKTRKLGVQITRETEEDMKAMQGLNAQQEVADILSYEINAEMDRQLLGEIVQAAARAGNCQVWNPAQADGRNQNERINALYTDVLNAASQIAVKSRRGAANWAVCSPSAAALLESQIYNPLSVGGGLGHANAFGKSIDNGIGVTEIGQLRNGTIKLYRDTLAGGDYILLGFKGNNVYDAGIIYLPYIPLELMQAQDPFNFNPITAARTRYGVTTNLFGAGQFYQFIGLEGIRGGSFDANASQRVFMM